MEGGVDSVVPNTISCDAALTLFATAIACAKENGGSECDILILKRL